MCGLFQTDRERGRAQKRGSLYESVEGGNEMREDRNKGVNIGGTLSPSGGQISTVGSFDTFQLNMRFISMKLKAETVDCWVKLAN